MKTFLSSLFCCVGLCLYVAAQQGRPTEKVDIQAAEGTKAASDVADTSFYISQVSRLVCLDSSLINARKLIETGKRINSKGILLEGYIDLGAAHINTAHLDSVRYYLDIVLTETEDAEEEEMLKYRARAFMLYGAMYVTHNLGQHTAFSYFRKAIETSKKVNYSLVYVRSSIALINNLVLRKEYDYVEEILTDAYQYLAEKDPQNYKAHSFLNKQKALYLNAKATTKSERREALDLILTEYNQPSSINTPIRKINLFIDIATRFAEDMSIEELMIMTEYNFSTYKNEVDGAIKGGLYEAYGHVLIEAKQYLRAIPYLVEARQFFKNEYEHDLAVCEDLILAYTQTNQVEKIGPLFEEYKVIYDKAITDLYSAQLLELEEKYESDKKEIENAQLQVKNSMIQTRFIYSCMIAALLLIILATGFYFLQKLRKTKLQLENSNEEKNKIFAILAHDLRNPISSLSNLSQKVKFLRENNRLEELEEMSNHTDAKLRALNDNLNTILLWAITESNLIDIKPVQVSLLKEVNMIKELYADEIIQKGIVIRNTVSDFNYVIADIRVVQTIIRNLISNAVKFSHPNGEIEVSVIELKNWVELRVVDYGMGLRDVNEQQSDINQSRENRVSGTGIGLKICRELALKSDLELSLETNPKGGTVGVIRFRKIA